jgi:hypothetical protein
MNWAKQLLGDADVVQEVGFARLGFETANLAALMAGSLDQKATFDTDSIVLVERLSQVAHQLGVSKASIRQEDDRASRMKGQ